MWSFWFICWDPISVSSIKNVQCYKSDLKISEQYSLPECPMGFNRYFNKAKEKCNDISPIKICPIPSAFNMKIWKKIPQIN